MQCASACMGKSGTNEKLHFLKYDNHGGIKGLVIVGD